MTIPGEDQTHGKNDEKRGSGSRAGRSRVVPRSWKSARARAIRRRRGEDVDYDGDISWASLPRLSVGEGVALREGEGESDGPTGVEDLGAVATWYGEKRWCARAKADG